MSPAGATGRCGRAACCEFPRNGCVNGAAVVPAQLLPLTSHASAASQLPLRWPASHLTWGIDVPQLLREGYVDPSARAMVAGYQTELRNQIEKVPRVHRSIGALNSVLRCIPNLSVIDAN